MCGTQDIDNETGWRNERQGAQDIPVKPLSSHTLASRARLVPTLSSSQPHHSLPNTEALSPQCFWHWTWAHYALAPLLWNQRFFKGDILRSYSKHGKMGWGDGQSEGAVLATQTYGPELRSQQSYTLYQQLCLFMLLCVPHVFVCTTRMQVSTVTLRAHWIPWKWSVWAAGWVLWTEHESSARAIKWS